MRNARNLALATLWAAFPTYLHAQSPACQVDIVSTTGGVPLQVQFDALGAGGDPPYTYEWDFGDGFSSTQKDPLHEYSDPGFYQAVLTVTPSGMPAACRDTAEILVGTVSDPACWAEASTTWSEDSNPIEFRSGPGLTPGTPHEWVWSFGDGNTHTVPSPNPSGVPPPWLRGYATPGTYWAMVWMRTAQGTYPCYPSLRITTLVPQPPVGVGPAGWVASLELERPRPNPFELATTLGYALPNEGPVRLVILDLQGRSVATLAEGVRPAGRHIAVWQGRNDGGRLVSGGVYVAVLEQGGKKTSTRIVRMP